MTDLSPSARKLLEDADENGFLYNNSGGLTGGVAIQVRRGLVAKGLLEQRRSDSGFGDPCEAFGGDVLRITDAGRAAIGIERPMPVPAADTAPTSPNSEPEAPKAADRPARTPRADSKQAKLLAMLQRDEGATVDEVAKAFDWQPHTTRAAISTLPKKADCPKPTSEKVEGRGRVYRVAAT